MREKCSGGRTAQQLQKLEILRAMGTITEDEYDAERRQIIAEL